MATIAEAARHIDLSERRFSELLDAGIIERQDRGRYDLEKVRVAYIRWMRSRLLGQTEKTGSELEKAADEARLAKAKADKAEMEAAQMRGELVTVQEVIEPFQNAVLIMKTLMLALPAKVATQVGAKSPARAEAVIREHVTEALDELSRVRVKRGGGKPD